MQASFYCLFVFKLAHTGWKSTPQVKLGGPPHLQKGFRPRGRKFYRLSITPGVLYLRSREKKINKKNPLDLLSLVQTP